MICAFVPFSNMSQAICTPWVEAHVARSIEVWNGCAARQLPAKFQYSRAEQRKREKAYDEGVRAVERELKKAPQTKAARLATQNTIIASFGRFAATAQMHMVLDFKKLGGLAPSEVLQQIGDYQPWSLSDLATPYDFPEIDHVPRLRR